MLLLKCICRVTFRYTAIYFFFVCAKPIWFSVCANWSCWYWFVWSVSALNLCNDRLRANLLLLTFHRHSGTVCWPCGEFKKWQTASVCYCFFSFFVIYRALINTLQRKLPLLWGGWLAGGFGVTSRLLIDKYVQWIVF